MKCDVCGKKEATVHLTEVVNDRVTKFHICEDCAKAKSEDMQSHFGLTDLISGLVDFQPSLRGGEVREDAGIPCPECGMTYEEFAKTGRLGCAVCYQGLSKVLMPLIKRVQRSTHHAGKKPRRLSTDDRAVYDLRLLQERLRKSVESEAFEDAARLRDEIKAAEQKSRKGKKK